MSPPNPGQRSIYDPSTRRTAVTVGLLFLTANLTFMVGDSLIQAAFSTDAGGTDTTTLIVGVILQAICGLAVAAIGLALLRILSRTNQLLARGASVAPTRP